MDAQHNYLEGFARKKKIRIIIYFPAQLQKLPESAEIALYRVVQEALPSLLQLSGNLRAKATLAVDKEHLSLRIGDEGQGLSPQVLEEVRSEEHTSELQSLRHLVCRLLLEKKKE